MAVAYDPNKSFMENMAAQTAGLDLNAIGKMQIATDPAQLNNTEAAMPQTNGGNVAGTPTPRTAANNWGDKDIQDAAKQLYSAMQTMTANGDEAGAKRLYKEKQAQFGFTDAQFSPIAQGANGVAYTAPQISEWKGNPETTVPQTAPVPQPSYTAPAPYTPPPQLNFNLNDIKQSQNWTVDPKTQTVAGQLESVLASDSPLLTQARTRALQRMNANGTLNSTMATSAADSAMYDAALQIATPDARTYGDAARFNADSSNQFARDGNQFLRQGYMADFNLRANDWAADREFGRTTQRDAIMQKYALERDRIQNDFTLSRDERQNALQVLRDSTQQTYNLARDAANNTATANRDTTANTNAIARDAAAAANAAKTAATSRLYGARADFTTSVNQLIQNKDLGPEARAQSVATLKTNYNAIIKQAAAELGWPEDSWLIKDTTDGGTAANAADTKAVVQKVSDGLFNNDSGS